jgi:quercetin dioxygenase-like cupin family protein
MQLIKDIQPKELVPGITGYYAHGENMSFGYVELKKGSSIPMHQHPHEQITYILEGRLDMIIGEMTCSLTAGMYHVINSQTPHAATAVTDCKVIDAFSPVREDYRNQE